MKKRLSTFVFALCAAALCSGCGTAMVRIVDGKAKRKHLYPAVRADAKMMKWYINPDGTVIASKSYLGAGLCIIDMPISAVFDTVFLPLDLYGRYEYRKDQEHK